MAGLYKSLAAALVVSRAAAFRAGVPRLHPRAGLRMMGTALPTKIVIGADGFGEELKDAVVDHLKTKAGIEVEDMGTDKYYVAAADVAKRVQDDKSTKGMLFCGTGMGVGIVANKFTGVYAATCENEAAARHSRSINNSNILAMGGLVTTVDDAVKIVDAWLDQEFCAKPGAEADWWSPEVEAFLSSKFPEIDSIEQDSRGR
mmetsp:Transcript_69674/g.194767  ORF Transcript_69674/g.194767 Transcript_69674/m.194767 type:complete len:202 (+) Transcript_69674:103-708(+)|eukprot:CAMPEP_0119503138 /NCGR_PEP_ID=MMETSP1344-20130328/24401_1 /TAXON_ID=236787 /ORGANISM="Florenciella parvula, Strain CCMP2471" /LENGTH=201 /DNA_ID=CAMNT_0007539403 /DNA_START=82 /DNA_END=690 /DNA_ORIENTATION=-